MAGPQSDECACPLCDALVSGIWVACEPRRYLRCGHCDLTFLERSQLPSRQEERAEYDLHENDPEDPRYRAHLARLTVPLLKGVKRGSYGLDFGSGPGPAISAMLAEQGMHMRNYDPFFAPDRTALEREYDFVSCTEVAEHFHEPGKDFSLLSRLLLPGGRLGVMTQLLSDDIDFSNWWYRQEISHVAFYSERTMHYIGLHFGWHVDVRVPNVALFAV